MIAWKTFAFCLAAIAFVALVPGCTSDCIEESAQANQEDMAPTATYGGAIRNIVPIKEFKAEENAFTAKLAVIDENALFVVEVVRIDVSHGKNKKDIYYYAVADVQKTFGAQAEKIIGKNFIIKEYRKDEREAKVSISAKADY